MSSQGTGNQTQATFRRKLRTLITDLMEEAEGEPIPVISRRVRDTRRRLQEQWKADHPGQRGNPYTQERVAARLGITTKSYGDYERFREPDLQRLREIAGAFNLNENYFAPTGDLATATAQVEAQVARLAAMNDQVAELLGLLRAQLAAGPDDPAPGKRGRRQR